ncbi:MAG: bifunctional UDP-N-acetylglucosamine diphosphorylase/glucosamine-1-phosphate N-acetyltransferase GlmU [Clostridiales bacterium]|nr:bifunctional UDP-N-acetylglucosamine diphosphorylase/glucosamine-1-phosphate N-acetyltransferase GlmU [Clostridiales bacterium]
MIDNSIAVILAAGGKDKMKSSYPRTMSMVLSRPMLDWVLTAVENSGIERICVVSGENERSVIDCVGQRASIVEQFEMKGTAHAVMQAGEFLRLYQDCDVLIINGDTPFMDAETIHSALTVHRQSGLDVTAISAITDKPFGHVRIVCDENDSFINVVEERDADKKTKKIKEVSSGAFWFKAGILLEALDNVEPRLDGTYRLVDVVKLFIDNGCKAGVFTSTNSNVVLDAHNRREVNALNEVARMSVINKLLDSGVNFPCFDGIMIDPTVEIGEDVTILPNTMIYGDTKIGRGCILGPNTYIEDSIIGESSILDNTKCRLAKVGNNASIGPFVQIRPNSVICDNVHLGNFVEVKNSSIDDGTKVSHLTYVGDSDVGKNVNFGCGTVTVNYNGKAKYRTTIGDNVFIGCNTNLIAPVKVGDYSYTAAGSTITEDVPPASLAIARARQINKEGWVAGFKDREKEKNGNV